MPSVEISALGTTRKLVGFSRRTVDFQASTLADLLRMLETHDGASLYHHLTCDGKLRGDYAIVIDGVTVSSDQLERPLSGGEQVVTMGILRHVAGG